MEILSNDIVKAVVLCSVALWFAIGWYFNDKIAGIHKRFDNIEKYLDGLREYLYEIDPQFDDERASSQRFEKSLETGQDIFAGMHDMELLDDKKAAGKRTLNTSFHSD